MGILTDSTDIDECALKSLKRELPKVAYPERDSLLYFILKRLGWIESHNLNADGNTFVKMLNPDKV
jgi:hypothetical protein